MTNIEEIFEPAARIYDRGQKEFSRLDVRNELALNSDEWHKGYTGGFQGMIENAPPLRSKIIKKYQGVFTRLRKGIYTFTKYGLSLINSEKIEYQPKRLKLK